MKIALDWIAEYLDAPVDPQAAENALITAGLPLESNEPHGPTHVLDVEVTSNRSDCLSHVGLARELAALLGRTFRPPQTAARATGPAVATLSSVQIEDAKACPYYSARVIQNVKVGPSPDWLIRRLESIGLRTVNNVVDVTNYVLMELGQPLHTFDFDALGGRQIIVRRAPGEKIVAIDNKSYTLDPSMLVIADAHRPVAVAGVMGGKETEVTEKTTNILLESARFDPVTIRAQARALTLMSDSSHRFERGIDPASAERASLRAAQLIAQLAGGTIAEGVIVAGSATANPTTVDLRTPRIAEVLGIEIPSEKIIAILTALGFAPEAISSSVLRCTVPSYRLDIDREIDLIEEVARVYGYSHITPHDRVTHPVQPEPIAEKARRAIRQALLAAGFNETVTVTFVDESEARQFLPEPAAAPIPVSDAVRKTSNLLRPSLLPSLLQVRQTNQNAGIIDARIFEHAGTFYQIGDPAKHAPTEHSMLALVGNSVAEIRGALEIVVNRLQAAATLGVKPQDYSWYQPGIAGVLSIHIGQTETPIGHIGQFAAEVQNRYDLRHPAAGAEIYWQKLIAAFEPVRRAKPLPRFPAVRRDLSIVLEDAVRWADLHTVLAQEKLPFLEAIDFVGTFRNQQIGPGKKSLTLTLEFRDPHATLRSEQVDAQMKAAVELLTTRFGAALRA